MKKTLALLLAVVMAVLAGCGKSSTAPASSTTGPASSGQSSTASAQGPESSVNTAVIVTKTDPGRLRADTINNLNCMHYNRLVYDYLFTRNRQGEFDPCLCTSYELDNDNMGVTLHLREGVKFHDGNVMTADDVLASLVYGKADTSSGSQLDYIDFDNSKALDSNTVYLKFNRINGVWLSSLLAIGIVEKAAYEAAPTPDDFYLDPMTTSAYVLDSWTSGDSLVFKAFPEYWYGAPKLETIIVRIISETSVALMELKTGGADLLFNIPLENYTSAIEMNGVVGYDGQPPLVNVFMGCNLHNEALNKFAVRQAIAYAIDWDSICVGAFGGAAEPCYSILGKNALGYDSTWETENPYQYDVEKAKACLAEAGYADGLTLRVLVDETPARALMAEQLFNMLGKIGITLEIDKRDQASTNDVISNSDDYDLYIRGAYNNSGDIVTFLATSMGFTAVNADADKQNGQKYLDLLADIQSEMDIEKRIALYKELQKEFMTGMMYWMPGVQMTIYAAMDENLTGVEMPGEYWVWNNAYFK